MLRLIHVFENGAGQLFSEFYAPLVIAENIPDHTLYEYLVFVKGDKGPEAFGSELVYEYGIGRLVAFKDLERKQAVDLLLRGSPGFEFGNDRFSGFSVEQGFGLRKEVGHKLLVVAGISVQ